PPARTLGRARPADAAAGRLRRPLRADGERPRRRLGRRPLREPPVVPAAAPAPCDDGRFRASARRRQLRRGRLEVPRGPGPRRRRGDAVRLAPGDGGGARAEDGRAGVAMAEEHVEFLVVGSGAGGAPLTHTLVTGGRRVLMLEKGPMLRPQYLSPDGLSDFKRDESFATGS